MGEGIRVLSSTFYLCLEGANTPRLPEAGEGGGEERPGLLHQVSPQFSPRHLHNVLATTGSLVFYCILKDIRIESERLRPLYVEESLVITHLE